MLLYPFVSVLDHKHFHITCGVVTTLTLGGLFTAILCLSILPTFPHFPSQVAIPSDVILYQLPVDSYWLASLTMELVGHRKCSAEVISVKCSDIQYNNNTVTTYIEMIDYLYFVEDASVMFSLNSIAKDDCNYYTPYYVWMFTSITQADINAEDNFEQLACASPPDGVECIKVTDSVPFVVQKSSYYFIRCDHDPNCTLLGDIQVNSTSYNFESTRTVGIDSIEIHTGQEEEHSLQLKSSSFHPISMEDDVCVLLQLKKSCDVVMESSVYHVTVDGRRRYDFLFYPFMIVGIILTAVIIYVIIYCIFIKKK